MLTDCSCALQMLAPSSRCFDAAQRDSRVRIKREGRHKPQAGYSSVGRASDCRICRYQMVPGSIPGGRIFWRSMPICTGGRGKLF